MKVYTKKAPSVVTTGDPVELAALIGDLNIATPDPPDVDCRYLAPAPPPVFVVPFWAGKLASFCLPPLPPPPKPPVVVVPTAPIHLAPPPPPA